MNHYRIKNLLFIIIYFEMASCRLNPSTAYEIPDNNVSKESAMVADTFPNNFCDFFYSEDTLNDTLHFNFEDIEDFGPVYLSEDELKQIYCEIKRGNIEAYKIMCHHYFYSYSQYIPETEMDKLICITDFLAQKYFYYNGYLACGNYIFDHLKFSTDDYYATTMITYYEKYFEFSRSKAVAKKLYDIFCGNYSFQDKNPVKAKYYEDFISDK